MLLVILRLIPAVPYNLINYTFGLTSMSLGTYLAASAIGIIPRHGGLYQHRGQGPGPRLPGLLAGSGPSGAAAGRDRLAGTAALSRGEDNKKGEHKV